MMAPLSKASQFKVQNFDEIRIKKIPNWGETKTITLKGEVNFPGEYVFEYGDKLADVIRRAGGFTQEAFLYGAVFSRESVSVLQKKKLKESIAKLKEKAAVMENSPATTGTTTTKGLSQTVQMIEKLSKESEELEPLGRVTINLEKDIEMFAKTSSNLTLQDKDTLYIPTLDDTVLVTGQVMNPTAIIYDDDDDVATYLAKAGGLTQLADDDNIIVIHANGDAQRYSEGLFFNGRVNVGRGSVIVVSQKLVTETGIQVAKDISSILYQFAITAASLKTVGGI